MKPIAYKFWLPAIYGSIIMFMSAPGQTYVLSMYLSYYQETYGLSEVFISGMYAIITLCSSILLISISSYIDVKGVGRIGLLGSFFMVAALCISGLADNVWILLMMIFILRFTGQGLMMVLSNTFVSKMYIENRGQALGINQIGSSLAMIIVPVLNYNIIHTYGWRMGFFHLLP